VVEVCGAGHHVAWRAARSRAWKRDGSAWTTTTWPAAGKTPPAAKSPWHGGAPVTTAVPRADECRLPRLRREDGAGDARPARRGGPPHHLDRTRNRRRPLHAHPPPPHRAPVAGGPASGAAECRLPVGCYPPGPLDRSSPTTGLPATRRQQGLTPTRRASWTPAGATRRHTTTPA